MKKTIILFSTILFVFQAWGQFVEISNLSVVRSSFLAASWNNKVYFIGGQTLNGVRLAYMDVYDESTGAVTQVAQDYPRFWPAVVAGDSGVYVIGGVGTGADTRRSALVYKSDGNWHAMDSIEDGQFIASAVKIDSFIIVGGGMQSSTSGSGRPHTNKIYIYNETTGIWKTRTLSQKRFLYSMATDGVSKVYFSGGYIGNHSDSLSDRVDIYDVLTDTWDTTSLSQGRGGSSAAFLNGKLFVAGGFYRDQNNSWRSSDVVDIYNVSNGTWTDTVLSVARGIMGVGVLHDEVVFFGGATDYNGIEAYTFYGVIDIYTDDDQSWRSYADGRIQCYQAFATSDNYIYTAGGYNGTTYWDAIDVYSRAVGFEELTTKETLKVYPNPSQGYVNVSNVSEEAEYQLMDHLGRLVSQGHLSYGNNRLNLTSVQPGLYFLRVGENIERLMIE